MFKKIGLVFSFGAVLCLGEPVAENSEIVQAFKTKIAHELSLSSLEGLLGFSSTGHKLSLGAGYDLVLVPGFQWGISAVFSDEKQSGERKTYFEGLLGPTLSFPFDSDLRSAWFLRTAVGFAMDAGKFRPASSLEIGKRFRLTSSIVYRPSLQLLTRLGEGSRDRVAFNIRFVSFSGVF